MIINLFRIFDPRTLFASNWVRVIIVAAIFFSSIFIKSFNLKKISLVITTLLYKEIISVINNKKEYFIVLILSLILFIIINNILGLIPFLFTASRHLAFTLTLAALIWTIRMLLNITKTLKHLIIHLTPIGTPRFLIAFIVCIESLRLLIRPLTLCIRLIANIVAGHLLIVLLRNLIVFLPKLQSTFIRTVERILLILEFRVSIIQSYVFSILIVLYLNESIYVNKKWIWISYSGYKTVTPKSRRTNKPDYILTFNYI